MKTQQLHAAQTVSTVRIAICVRIAISRAVTWQAVSIATSVRFVDQATYVKKIAKYLPTNIGPSIGPNGRKANGETSVPVIIKKYKTFRERETLQNFGKLVNVAM